MKAPNTNQSLILVALTTVLLSACGSSGVTGEGASLPQNGNTSPDMIPTGPLDVNTGAYPLSFKSVGFDPNGGPASVTTSPALRTDTKLMVKVSAKTATRNEYANGTYANFTANYKCVTLAVTLQVQQNGTYSDLATVVTDRLSAAGTGGCSGSVASQTIDFSAYMSSGHGNVKIKIQALTSDFDCVRAAQYPYQYWGILQSCQTNPMRSVYQYHVVNGTAEVQVNGTAFVQP